MEVTEDLNAEFELSGLIKELNKGQAQDTHSQALLWFWWSFVCQRGAPHKNISDAEAIVFYAFRIMMNSFKLLPLINPNKFRDDLQDDCNALKSVFTEWFYQYFKYTFSRDVAYGRLSCKPNVNLFLEGLKEGWGVLSSGNDLFSKTEDKLNELRHEGFPDINFKKMAVLVERLEENDGSDPASRLLAVMPEGEKVEEKPQRLFYSKEINKLIIAALDDSDYFTNIDDGQWSSFKNIVKRFDQIRKADNKYSALSDIGAKQQYLDELSKRWLPSSVFKIIPWVAGRCLSGSGFRMDTFTLTHERELYSKKHLMLYKNYSVINEGIARDDYVGKIKDYMYGYLSTKISDWLCEAGGENLDKLLGANDSAVTFKWLITSLLNPEYSGLYNFSQKFLGRHVPEAYNDSNLFIVKCVHYAASAIKEELAATGSQEKNNLMSWVRSDVLLKPGMQSKVDDCAGDRDPGSFLYDKLNSKLDVDVKVYNVSFHDPWFQGSQTKKEYMLNEDFHAILTEALDSETVTELQVGKRAVLTYAGDGKLLVRIEHTIKGPNEILDLNNLSHLDELCKLLKTPQGFGKGKDKKKHLLLAIVETLRKDLRDGNHVNRYYNHHLMLASYLDSLAMELGYHITISCKSAKDRTGYNIANTLAVEEFWRSHGKIPASLIHQRENYYDDYHFQHYYMKHLESWIRGISQTAGSGVNDTKNLENSHRWHKKSRSLTVERGKPVRSIARVTRYEYPGKISGSSSVDCGHLFPHSDHRTPVFDSNDQYAHIKLSILNYMAKTYQLVWDFYGDGSLELLTTALRDLIQRSNILINRGSFNFSDYCATCQVDPMDSLQEEMARMIDVRARKGLVSPKAFDTYIEELFKAIDIQIEKLKQLDGSLVYESLDEELPVPCRLA